MIGRTAPSNPWIFRQIEQYCTGLARTGPGLTELCPTQAFPTLSYEQPSEADRYQMIRTYFRMLIEEELPDAVGKMKQFASWFTHGVPGAQLCAKPSTNQKARQKFSDGWKISSKPDYVETGALARQVEQRSPVFNLESCSLANSLGQQ